jgi:A/G-specific adenine glycosylase
LKRISKPADEAGFGTIAPMKTRVGKIQEVQNIIFSWWKNNRRDLPWRHTHNPYHILVSEVMLQQTQVRRVIPKYAEFIEAFPTAAALAQSTTAHVLKLWKGMGYNRRALYLKKTAEAVVRDYAGVFPDDEAKLLQLPGVGLYTARAIQVFAYKKDVAAVDTNIRKIIVHFLFDDLAQKESVIQEAADALVPKGRAWEWHQALMDYGALQMKTLQLKIKTKGRTSIPFRETNRFFRGRIMDLLRVRAYKEVELIDDVAQTYDRSESFIVSIIAGLVKDELIVRKRGMVSLPE